MRHNGADHVYGALGEAFFFNPGFVHKELPEGVMVEMLHYAI